MLASQTPVPRSACPLFGHESWGSESVSVALPHDLCGSGPHRYATDETPLALVSAVERFLAA